MKKSCIFAAWFKTNENENDNENRLKMNAPNVIYMPNELLSEGWTRHVAGQDTAYIKREDLMRWLQFKADELKAKADEKTSGDPEEMFLYGKSDAFRAILNHIKPENDPLTYFHDYEYACAYSSRIYEALAERFKIFENFGIGCNDVSDIVMNAIFDALGGKGFVQCATMEGVNEHQKAILNGEIEDYKPQTGSIPKDS